MASFYLRSTRTATGEFEIRRATENLRPASSNRKAWTSPLPQIIAELSGTKTCLQEGRHH